jgi:hypothetical protein
LWVLCVVQVEVCYGLITRPEQSYQLCVSLSVIRCNNPLHLQDQVEKRKKMTINKQLVLLNAQLRVSVNNDIWAHQHHQVYAVIFWTNSARYVYKLGYSIPSYWLILLLYTRWSA